MDGGVKVKRYRADNGVYAYKRFKAACNAQGQKLSLCGVNAHWQNGIAERSIRTVVEKARTMLLHAMHHWPDEVSVDLWPFALHIGVAEMSSIKDIASSIEDISVFAIFSFICIRLGFVWF